MNNWTGKCMAKDKDEYDQQRMNSLPRPQAKKITFSPREESEKKERKEKKQHNWN